jgi:hypothetical protein
VGTLFTCKVCGRTHEAVKDPPSVLEPEELEALRATLKAAWLASEEKLDKSPNNEHFEKAQRKAWFAYMATVDSGVERLPESVTTRGGRGGLFFTCTWHVEVEPNTFAGGGIVESFIYSTAMVRESVFVPPGLHAIRGLHENAVGEKWVDLDVGKGVVWPVITATHWGPTPLGNALKPVAPGVVAELHVVPPLPPPVPMPPRCVTCNAHVHPDHLAEHRLRRCQPGLHQRP